MERVEKKTCKGAAERKHFWSMLTSKTQQRAK